MSPCQKLYFENEVLRMYDGDATSKVYASLRQLPHFQLTECRILTSSQRTSYVSLNQTGNLINFP